MGAFSLSVSAVKARRPLVPGQRDQMLQQEHADTAVVHVIGDRKGDLGRPGRGIVALVAAAADQLAVQQGEQRGVVRRGRDGRSGAPPARPHAGSC